MLSDDQWKQLALPGEYDAMDACDQARWRGVIEQAYLDGLEAAKRAVDDIDEPPNLGMEPKYFWPDGRSDSLDAIQRLIDEAKK